MNTNLINEIENNITKRQAFESFVNEFKAQGRFLHTMPSSELKEWLNANKPSIDDFATFLMQMYNAECLAKEEYDFALNCLYECDLSEDSDLLHEQIETLKNILQAQLNGGADLFELLQQQADSCSDEYESYILMRTKYCFPMITESIFE